MTQQAVGWALHALEPDEEMAVLLHLPHCAACRAAVAEAEEVLATLGGVVPSAEPPPALRERLLSAAAATEQRPSVLQARAERVPDRVPAPARSGAGRRHRLDAEDRSGLRPRRSWLSSRGRRLVASSLAVVAVLAVGGLAVRATQLEQQRDAESAQAQGLSELIAQLDEPGSRHALLAAADNSTVAAVLLANGERQVYTLGLAANSRDRTYVLWGIGSDARPVPLGTFDVDRADRGLRTVGSAAEAEDYGQYAISIEPGRVAPASPTEVVASGQVEI